MFFKMQNIVQTMQNIVQTMQNIVQTMQNIVQTMQNIVQTMHTTMLIAQPYLGVHYQPKAVVFSRNRSSLSGQSHLS